MSPTNIPEPYADEYNQSKQHYSFVSSTGGEIWKQLSREQKVAIRKNLSIIMQRLSQGGKGKLAIQDVINNLLTHDIVLTWVDKSKNDMGHDIGYRSDFTAKLEISNVPELFIKINVKNDLPGVGRYLGGYAEAKVQDLVSKNCQTIQDIFDREANSYIGHQSLKENQKPYIYINVLEALYGFTQENNNADCLAICTIYPFVENMQLLASNSNLDTQYQGALQQIRKIMCKEHGIVDMSPQNIAYRYLPNGDLEFIFFDMGSIQSPKQMCQSKESDTPQ